MSASGDDDAEEDAELSEVGLLRKCVSGCTEKMVLLTN
mgnify:FL=1